MSVTVAGVATGGGLTKNIVQNLPTLLGCRIFFAADPTVNNGALTTMLFTDEVFDTGNFHVGGFPSRITVTVPGIYNVGYQSRFQLNGAGTRNAIIRLNGGATNLLTTVLASSGAGGDTWIGGSTVWQFSAGDFIELQLFQQSGANLTTTPSLWISA